MLENGGRTEDQWLARCGAALVAFRHGLTRRGRASARTCRGQGLRRGPRGADGATGRRRPRGHARGANFGRRRPHRSSGLPGLRRPHPHHLRRRECRGHRRLRRMSARVPRHCARVPRSIIPRDFNENASKEAKSTRNRGVSAEQRSFKRGCGLR